METIDELEVEPRTATVFEHGWQSWSPTTSYALSETPWRSRSERNHQLCYRPEVHPGEDHFHGEGLLAVVPYDGGPVHLWAAKDGQLEVPSIRAERHGARLQILADGPVDRVVDEGEGGLDGALARWADGFAERVGVADIRPAPTIWCSWYHYFTEVTEQDMLENLDTMDELELPVDVVQLDDGYQAELGDWLRLSDRFDSVADLTARIRDRGRRAGIWVAPFLVSTRSELAANEPDWLLKGEDGEPLVGGRNWAHEQYVLDTTHPVAASYLQSVFRTMHHWGIDFFKIDFVYAAALEGRRHAEGISPLEAYRDGIRLIREAIGDAYLLGCGAPILPTVGLVDAMRVSPDTEPHVEPLDGDMSQPGSRPAMITGRGRAFQHGRFWVNDPDCLIARPAIEGREAWAEHVLSWGGLRGSSDRLAELDDWGIEVTHRALSETPPERFVAS